MCAHIRTIGAGEWYGSMCNLRRCVLEVHLFQNFWMVNAALFERSNRAGYIQLMPLRSKLKQAAILII